MTGIFNHEEIFREISSDFMNQSTSGDVSGFNQFNFLLNGGGIMPTNEFEINNQNGRILFHSDFFSGVDTLNKFHLLYNEQISLPGVVNGGTGTSSFGFFGPALNLLGYSPAQISFSGAADTNQWVCQSQNVIKVGENETSYFFYRGSFRDLGHSTTPEVSIESRENIFTTHNFAQAEWNIDTLDGSESASNPSGITLDKNSVMTFVIKFTYNSIGDVKFGLFIDNKFVLAHEIKVSNTLPSGLGSTNKPIRAEGGLEGSDAAIKVGLFDTFSGYYFKLLQTQDGGPDEYNFNIKSLSGFAVGSNQNDYYKTFADGNGVNLITVGGTRIPIVTIRPKQNFPPPLSPDVSTTHNLAIMSLKEIKVSGTSENPNDGVFIEVVFNQGDTLLTGTSFLTGDVNSAIEINKTSTAIALGGTQIYRKTIYSNQGSLDLTIKAEDLLGNFMNQYSHTVFLGGVMEPQNITPEITIVATSITANTVDISAEFVWVERP